MGFFSFLYRQRFVHPKPLPSSIDLKGQTLLITGGNTGIGLEATRELIAHNVSHVILAVRTISKGEAARQDLIKTNPKCVVEIWELDLESFSSVCAFGKKAQLLDRLDIVFLNAGLKKLEFFTAASGHEMTVQVNHLSTALASLMIMEPMIESARKIGKPGRMVITSSGVHIKASNILRRLDEKDSFGTQPERYNVSKLLNVLWARKLATKTSPDQVVINTVNPGLCLSNLHRDESSAAFATFNKIFGRPAIEGGYFLADAAVNQEKGSHGSYISEQKVIPASTWVLSAEGAAVQKKLWKETVELLRTEVPEADLKWT
ncbi:hypothetical protein HYALB_00001919 [Hymenoscyphus albidus]|uniref:Uncharacterized protein n=1 Tax=Hymenoscyphus albidus TaxID=595503 RepID=A0A9N9LAT5_9HELO|nr:hypothetical protein HYALB_00001919 [Hymenoscyphus albidus]